MLHSSDTDKRYKDSCFTSLGLVFRQSPINQRDFIKVTPRPTLQQFRQTGIINQLRFPILTIPVLRGLWAFGSVFGQFGLLPTAAALGADAVEEFAGDLDVWVGGTPGSSQTATESRSLTTAPLRHA
jgi:hypothetical protein